MAKRVAVQDSEEEVAEEEAVDDLEEMEAEEDEAEDASIETETEMIVKVTEEERAIILMFKIFREKMKTD